MAFLPELLREADSPNLGLAAATDVLRHLEPLIDWYENQATTYREAGEIELYMAHFRVQQKIIATSRRVRDRIREAMRTLGASEAGLSEDIVLP